MRKNASPQGKQLSMQAEVKTFALSFALMRVTWYDAASYWLKFTLFNKNAVTAPAQFIVNYAKHLSTQTHRNQNRYGGRRCGQFT